MLSRATLEGQVSTWQGRIKCCLQDSLSGAIVIQSFHVVVISFQLLVGPTPNAKSWQFSERTHILPDSAVNIQPTSLANLTRRNDVLRCNAGVWHCYNDMKITFLSLVQYVAKLVVSTADDVKALYTEYGIRD